MLTLNKKYLVLFGILFFMNVQHGYAGPPFNTDDPETVRYKHWEYYISSINTYQFGVWSGTSLEKPVAMTIVSRIKLTTKAGDKCLLLNYL